MGLSISVSTVREKCGLTGTSWDTKISNLIGDWVPALEHALDPDFTPAVRDAWVAYYHPLPCLAINWPNLRGGTQRLLLRLIATIVVALATLAGCSNRDCAYYGGADANTRCVVVGPAPIGAGP